MTPVLMTASVSTGGMPGACYSDAERESMYVESLGYYLSAMPGQDIVFAENSGWDLERLRSKLPASLHEAARRHVEFVAVPPSTQIQARGKGYNEVVLMAYAVEHSAMIRRAGSFFKVTGRYPVYNLARFVAGATRAFGDGVALYCDIKDHSIYDRLHTGWEGHSFEARLFGCRVDFFNREILTRLDELDDSTSHGYLEQVMFRLVKSTRSRVSDRFDREPHLGGVAGHIMEGNLTYSRHHDDAKSKFKRLLGNTIRIFVPWLKF